MKKILHPTEALRRGERYYKTLVEIVFDFLCAFAPLRENKIGAELFEAHRSVITKHLSNIYAEEELDKETTCAKIAQVQTEGNRNCLASG